MQFNRHLNVGRGFCVLCGEVRKKFGDNYSTRALQNQTCLKPQSMIWDRLGDVPKLSIELNPRTITLLLHLKITMAKKVFHVSSAVV